MGPRAALAHKLKAQGLNNVEIAERMGISHVRVWHIFNPSRKKQHDKNYIGSDKWRKQRYEYNRSYYHAHKLEFKLHRTLGIGIAKAREMVNQMDPAE